jgi:hypothetical protein
MPGNFLRTVTVTPVSETSAVAAGDIICDTTEIPGASSASNQPFYLVGCNVFDQDDNTAADLRIVFMAGSTSLGSLNSAPNISDANGLQIIGDILIASADWHDLGGFKYVRIDPAKLPLPCHPKAETNSLYFAVLAGGATTSTVGGLKLRFYFQDVYPF